MNKLYGFLSIILLAGTLAHACELTIVNDKGIFAMVTDHNPNADGTKDRVTFVLPNKKRLVGENPNVRADFDIRIQQSLFSIPRRFKIKQIACSKEHALTIKVSDIFNNKLDKSLFTIEEIKKGNANE